MSSLTIINLDWRTVPESREVFNAIETLFVEADSSGEVKSIFSQSKAKGIIKLELYDGVLMMTRQGRSVDRQQLDSRFIGFKETEPEAQQSLRVVKKNTLDLALTIGTHPAAFGVRHEESGKVHIPQGTTIETTTVVDFFKFNDRDRAKAPIDGCTNSIMTPGQNNIPCSVVELHLKFESLKYVINAIIVVEHPNLAEMITNRRQGFPDVLVLMTAGYPSGLTKEFLHLLYNDARLKDKPFLYFADHDMQAISIFQTLKYGSKNSAWVSASMVCPGLRYVGPTKQDLLDLVKVYRAGYEQDWKRTHPDASPEEVRDVVSVWERSKEHKVKTKFKPKTPKDQEMYTAFRNSGLLEHEELVKREVELIMGGYKGKFRLADLTVVDNRYLRQYFQTKLQDNCPGRVASEEEANRLPSQSSSAHLVGGGATRSTSVLDSSMNDAANPTTGGARDLSPGARAIRDFAELARSAP
ncbi:MAG: hypothetical protein Q9184_002495 [Pyrenodesmia sp. 2 TL-2023]